MTSLRGLQLDIPTIGGNAFEDEVNKFAWVLQLRMNDAAAPLNNFGTATTDATATNITFRQSGGLFDDLCVAYAAADSNIQFTADASWINAQAFSIIAILQFDVLGAISSRAFQTSNDRMILNVLTTGSVEARVNRTVNATLLTAAGVESASSAFKFYALLFDTTNNLRVYRGVGGVLTQLGGTVAAGSGAVITQGNMVIGNGSGLNRVHDGKYAFWGLSTSVFTEAQLRALLVASGV